MEIANHLDKFETPWGIDLVLLDAEELVYGESPPLDQYFLGAVISPVPTPPGEPRGRLNINTRRASSWTWSATRTWSSIKS